MGRLTEVGDAVREILGTGLKASRPLHGGDLSEVLLLERDDGLKTVCKIGPHVAKEASMLRSIVATGAPAPQVLGVKSGFLFLEFLQEHGPSEHGWTSLGSGLHTLHAATGSQFGWTEDYAFGPVRIDNTFSPDWPTFWEARRLRPFLPQLPRALARRLEALCARLPEHLPCQPIASLLHGDLWSGNVLFGANSAYLIDPASYYGHREVDLAMLELFGQPGRGFWEAYGETEPDYDTRIHIYQLWPALVHFSLFGTSYLGMIDDRLSRLGF